MLRWLQAVVDWIFSRRSSLIELSLQAPHTNGASRNKRPGPDPPNGPYDRDSGVRVPKWYGPAGRSASVAVLEPVDDESVVAVGGPVSHPLIRQQFR
jgi:hypothetical protein